MTSAKNMRVGTESNQIKLEGLADSGATEILSDRRVPARARWAWAGAGRSFDWMDWHDLSVAIPGSEIEA
jgi:hypothetical protein